VDTLKIVAGFDLIKNIMPALWGISFISFGFSIRTVKYFPVQKQDGVKGLVLSGNKTLFMILARF